jgi:hypothetical protein
MSYPGAVALGFREISAKKAREILFHGLVGILNYSIIREAR